MNCGMCMCMYVSMLIIEHLCVHYIVTCLYVKQNQRSLAITKTLSRWKPTSGHFDKSISVLLTSIIHFLVRCTLTTYPMYLYAWTEPYHRYEHLNEDHHSHSCSPCNGPSSHLQQRAATALKPISANTPCDGSNTWRQLWIVCPKICGVHTCTFSL